MTDTHGLHGLRWRYDKRLNRHVLEQEIRSLDDGTVEWIVVPTLNEDEAD